ncbi:hypothetical protein G6F37_007470 [Rhizopus arrhizus]|nr:hypothetical protein G6F38_011444 [Rhizopus arrhizus]KAG1156595.1 hypothetical protein G6F37_007470 [Rhizopus arrhizus]
MTDNTRQRTDLKVLTTEYLSTAQTAVAQVRQKANHMVTSAKSLIPQVSVPPLDALSTVMFSPLAAHPVYRSESMMRAMQIMQQQQRGGSTSTAIARPRSDLVLHGTSYAWPSSVALLEEEIPESNEPVSLFQGFAATYPSLAKPKKRSRQRKRKMVSDSSSVYSQERKEERETPKTVKGIVAQRERKVRELDRVGMQKSSVVNEIEQLDLQLNELLMKRKGLEQTWEDLDKRDTELQLIIEGLDEAIIDIETGGEGHIPLKLEADNHELESPMELYRRLFTGFHDE